MIANSLRFKELEYEDRNILLGRLRAKNSNLSEYAFSNAYLFREPHKYEVAFCDDCIFLKGVTYDNVSYYMPVCPLEIIPQDMLINLSKEIDCFFPIEERWLNFFPPHLFDYKFNDSDSDYIYTTEKLATLAGRKLSKKRNLLKQFHELYANSKVVKLDKTNINDAIELLKKWLEETMTDGELADFNETKEAIEKYEELNLEGFLAYVDDNIAGFILGEELNEETFVFHFAKASRRYKGIYQFLYNSTANLLINRYKYINFEQDLGKDTLRQAKSTYYPDMMQKKYRVSLKRASL